MENDIYDNKGKFERFKARLNELTKKPEAKGKRKYFVRNKANLAHFRTILARFEAKDISYIRRNRLLSSMVLICSATEKDLKVLEREDIDRVVAFMHSQYKSPKSKSDFIRDVKCLWRILFPERDDKGRIDETATPYAVKHLSPKIDKSREKLRSDRLTWDEYERIVCYFSKDPRVQCYLSLSLESLGRPQELLYLKLKDVQVFDNYAKIWISEHGKEGVGMLQCIDSYPYLVNWLDKHPLKNDKDAFLFINLAGAGFGRQMTPFNVNKFLKKALLRLGIDKPVTCYSLKRCGVTFRRLRGESDLEIQHAARWTSTKQLNTYDKSEQEDAFKIQLARRGLIKDKEMELYHPATKECICGKVHGFTARTCDSCKRPLDREEIKKQFNMMEKMERFIEFLESKPELKQAIEAAVK